MKKEIINSSKAPDAIGPYSHANKIGDLVFVSGQIPMVDGKLAGGIKEQTRAALNNVGYILEEAGSSFENVVKVTVYLTDMSYFKEMNEVYAEYFKKDCPARACFAVKGLPANASVEIECIAAVK